MLALALIIQRYRCDVGSVLQERRQTADLGAYIPAQTFEKLSRDVLSRYIVTKGLTCRLSRTIATSSGATAVIPDQSHRISRKREKISNNVRRLNIRRLIHTFSSSRIPMKIKPNCNLESYHREKNNYKICSDVST